MTFIHFPTFFFFKVFAMSVEHFLWKKHHFFLNNRPKQIPISFCPNLSGGYTLTNIPKGLHCSFGDFFDFRTVFLSQVIKEGTFCWRVRIKYGTLHENSTLWAGAAPADLLSVCNSRVLGGVVLGTWALWISRNCRHQLESRLVGVKHRDIIPYDETQVPDGALVTIELDSGARTLSFFVNGAKIPRIAACICFPCHFGITGVPNISFTAESLSRLPTPIPSSVVCVQHEAILN